MRRRGSRSEDTREVPASRLKQAVRQARVDQAERTGVVVDLHDADLARLEILNEELDPLFEEVPAEIDLFDRGISRGETPRLWVDPIAHVAMGRDKRVYRFVQDTRYGRTVLAESANVPDLVDAVTKYLAQRLVERERSLAEEGTPMIAAFRQSSRYERQRRRIRAVLAFLRGLAFGFAVLVGAAMLAAP
jgi:hypothetical protein